MDLLCIFCLMFAMLLCTSLYMCLVVTCWERADHLSLICGVHLLTLNLFIKVSKGAKIRNRYNQVPHLTQDTNGKVTNSQLDTTNESQEASPFPAGDHKAHINRRTQRHSKHKT